MDRIFKHEKNKEFECRQCAIFLNVDELVEGKCPECKKDEDLFDNSLNDEEE